MSPLNQPDFKNQDSEDGLEVLKKNLYSRKDYFPSEQEKRGEFKKHEVPVAKNWAGGGANIANRSLEDPVRRMSFLKKFFLVSMIFFTGSVGVALYVFFGGGNIVSSNNVDITVTGPVAVAGGEVLPLEVGVTNQNNADFETADLTIDYPQGTREPSDTSVELKRYRQSLGPIAKGATASKKVQAIIFGQSGETKIIGVSVEYRLKGSNAIFSKKKDYGVSISSAPVTVTVSSVKEINANQEMEFAIDVVSNSNSVIQKLALSAEYPFGFSFDSADPAPSWSNSFWQLGDIKPGVKRTVKIRGKIAGQDNEDRTFRFSVGTESPTNENAIGTAFLTENQKVTLRKPFIGASLALDGDTSDTYIAKPGKAVRADLTISNNAGVKMTDVKVSASPSGNIFDQGSVTVTEGFYRSSDNKILWDQTLKSGLSILNPDDTVTLSFSLSALPEEAIRTVSNPAMNISLTVTGKRLNDSGVSEEVKTTVSKTIKVASTLGLSTRALYYSGAFTNSGPIPPKVNSETSYTIVWTLTNGSNDLSNVRVSATLPSYVKWLGVSSPPSEKISYNPIGGEVLWEAGELKSGTGFLSRTREVSFQVSLTPSSSQFNSAPTLITEAAASGDDSFAGVSVETDSRVPLSTNLTTDIGFRQGQGAVTK